MNKRLWIVFAALVIVAVGGLVFWKNNESVSGAYVENLDGTKLISKQNIVDAMNKSANNGNLSDTFKTDESLIIPDHFLGKADSKVTVIEYEDFACTACNSFASSAKEIHDEYKDRVLFIYRNFNLNQNTSTLSESGAEATYLVGGEDKYWEMHDLIFSNEVCVEGNDRNLCQQTITDYAKQIGLDSSKFEKALKDFSSNGINDKIKRDKALGIQAKVSATPTWIINGKRIEGANKSNMKAAIDSALEATK